MKQGTQVHTKRNMPTKSERNRRVSGGRSILQSPEGGHPKPRSRPALLASFQSETLLQ